jgi:hypothetical protein
MDWGDAMHKLAGAFLCLMLAACAGSPAALTATADDIEKAAGVAPGQLIMYAPSSFASASGGRLTVDFVAGVFAQTQAQIHLLSYDRIDKSFHRDMTFDTATLRGVALVSGPFGRKQLQIQTENGVVACHINGRAGVSDMYARLIAAGARPFESPGWINPIAEPQPVVIPIYIPSGR